MYKFCTQSLISLQARARIPTSISTPLIFNQPQSYNNRVLKRLLRGLFHFAGSPYLFESYSPNGDVCSQRWTVGCSSVTTSFLDTWVFWIPLRRTSPNVEVTRINFDGCPLRKHRIPNLNVEWQQKERHSSEARTGSLVRSEELVSCLLWDEIPHSTALRRASAFDGHSGVGSHLQGTLRWPDKTSEFQDQYSCLMIP